MTSVRRFRRVLKLARDKSKLVAKSFPDRKVVAETKAKILKAARRRARRALGHAGMISIRGGTLRVVYLPKGSED